MGHVGSRPFVLPASLSLLHASEVIKLAPPTFHWNVPMKIYVGNLSFNTEEPQLEQLFSPLGDVASVRLVRDHETGRSRGFGFVEMNDDTQGRAACEALDQKEFDGRRLTVNEARPQERREGGGGGFSRGNGGGGGGNRQRRERW
jgi:RNA recognition motif-containing protein